MFSIRATELELLRELCGSVRDKNRLRIQALFGCASLSTIRALDHAAGRESDRVVLIRVRPVSSLRQSGCEHLLFLKLSDNSKTEKRQPSVGEVLSSSL